MELDNQTKRASENQAVCEGVQTEADWAQERTAACPSGGGPEVSTGIRDSQTNLKPAVKCSMAAVTLLFQDNLCQRPRK